MARFCLLKIPKFDINGIGVGIQPPQQTRTHTHINEWIVNSINEKAQADTT